MDNVYVLVTYVAMLIALVGCGLVKLSDILEKKRDEKYYQMIRKDAAFLEDEGRTNDANKNYDGASQEVSTKIRFDDFDEYDEDIII